MTMTNWKIGASGGKGEYGCVLCAPVALQIFVISLTDHLIYFNDYQTNRKRYNGDC